MLCSHLEEVTTCVGGKREASAADACYRTYIVFAEIHRRGARARSGAVVRIFSPDFHNDPLCICRMILSAINTYKQRANNSERVQQIKNNPSAPRPRRGKALTNSVRDVDRGSSPERLLIPLPPPSTVRTLPNASAAPEDRTISYPVNDNYKQIERKFCNFF
ncbi:hypothetical protein BDFB_014565 [Asbolus verrucosus]|uniref:Uncharacterized protein n=1 Tax=Asbolus verrucosus TaxID=1661398 RepID=A0A482VPC2_ASBVE|nr:hypothetical protein BDFB_014565 [Asbolus verrucosus]